MEIKYEVKNIIKTNAKSEKEKEFIFNSKLFKVIMILEKLRLEGLTNDYRML